MVSRVDFARPAFYTRFALPLQTDSKGFRDFLLQSDLEGVNVTVPFKEVAYGAVDEAMGIASDLEAVNTIVRRKDRLIGYNTDAAGFLLSLGGARFESALILGAGGSARSVALILENAGLRLCIANRSREKLEFFKSMGKTTTLECLDLSGKYDLVVNATSAGLSGDLPLPPKALETLLARSHMAVDLMYQMHGDTAFCALAKGITNSMDGKALLVAQAALAFRHFHLGLDYEVALMACPCLDEVYKAFRSSF